MATIKGLFGVLTGLGVAAGSLVMVVVNSPFVTMTPNVREVYLWTVAFLLGVFIFGWGVAKLTGY